MPNWCTNCVALIGNKEELKHFYKHALDADDKCKKTNRWWTCAIMEEYGFTIDEVLHDPLFEGGSLDYIKPPETFRKDKFVLVFDVTSRWRPIIGLLNKLFDRFYISIKAYYVCEEPGCDIYINTDTKGEYFFDKYVIYDDDLGSEYFDSDESLIDFLKKEYDYDLSLIDNLHDDDVIEVKRGKEISFHRFVDY